jgi:hypothetical protein
VRLPGQAREVPDVGALDLELVPTVVALEVVRGPVDDRLFLRGPPPKSVAVGEVEGVRQGGDFVSREILQRQPPATDPGHRYRARGSRH